jgi:hypothetical protein
MRRTTRRTSAPRRTLLAFAGVVVGLLFSACSVHPGYAAVVGDSKISEGDVDDVASALCSVQGSSGQQALATRAARQGALDVLISSELSRQFGDSQGVTPDQEQVSAALKANEQNIQGLPEEHRQVFTDTLRGYAEGQLMLADIGRKALASQGKSNVTDQQAISAGTTLRNKWAEKHADVSVDPRYGDYQKGALLSKSGSLSVAQSQQATDGDSPDPSQGWIASLPATQKCS